MVEIALFGLGILLISEYGFQTRKRAIALWQGKWIWRRSLLRALALVALWSVSNLGLSLHGFIYCLTFWIVGELGAAALRGLFRSRQRVGFQHGGLITHVFPFLFAGFYLLIARLLLWVLGSPDFLAPLRQIRGPMTYIVIACLLWTWGTFFTVSVIDLARPEQVEDQVRPRVGAGELIGILERYLTFLLVASGGWAAVGFVIAAKAAARFPLFEHKEFAEYFLLGSISSVGLAILAGVIVQAWGI